MNVVHINGVALIPGIDYTVGDTLINFSVPPPAGADIVFTEVISPTTGATHMTRLYGDGSTFLFRLETNFTDRVQLNQMFELAIKYKDNPTVRDALDKLKVVLELVKDDTLRQR
jgi:hypothetical protein